VPFGSDDNGMRTVTVALTGRKTAETCELQVVLPHIRLRSLGVTAAESGVQGRSLATDVIVSIVVD
jgi:hypothetical protein